jgi:hypothetical protein
MQIASALRIGGLICPRVRAGRSSPPSKDGAGFGFRLLRLAVGWKPTGARRFVFDALLLLALPLLLTLRTFVELPEFATSSHQFDRFIGGNLI